MIASRTQPPDDYLGNSIRAVYTRLGEFVKKTLGGLFEPFASSVPNLVIFPACSSS